MRDCESCHFVPSNVCQWRHINKAYMCGKSIIIKHIPSQPFSALHWWIMNRHGLTLSSSNLNPQNTSFVYFLIIFWVHYNSISSINKTTKRWSPQIKNIFTISMFWGQLVFILAPIWPSHKKDTPPPPPPPPDNLLPLSLQWLPRCGITLKMNNNSTKS